MVKCLYINECQLMKKYQNRMLFINDFNFVYYGIVLTFSETFALLNIVLKK